MRNFCANTSLSLSLNHSLPLDVGFFSFTNIYQQIERSLDLSLSKSTLWHAKQLYPLETCAVNAPRLENTTLHEKPLACPGGVA
jgi:hypothetical protein